MNRINMYFQLILQRVAIITKATSVEYFSFMNQIYMFLQSLLWCKFSLAYTAIKLYSFVNWCEMHFQIILINKTMATFIALVRFCFIMEFILVLWQFFLCQKAFTTKFTSEFSIVIIIVMFFKLTFLVKGFGAS